MEQGARPEVGPRRDARETEIPRGDRPRGEGKDRRGRWGERLGNGPAASLLRERSRGVTAVVLKVTSCGLQSSGKAGTERTTCHRGEEGARRRQEARRRKGRYTSARRVERRGAKGKPGDRCARAPRCCDCGTAAGQAERPSEARGGVRIVEHAPRPQPVRATDFDLRPSGGRSAGTPAQEPQWPSSSRSSVRTRPVPRDRRWNDRGPVLVSRRAGAVCVANDTRARECARARATRAHVAPQIHFGAGLVVQSTGTATSRRPRRRPTQLRRAKSSPKTRMRATDRGSVACRP